MVPSPRRVLCTVVTTHLAGCVPAGTLHALPSFETKDVCSVGRDSSVDSRHWVTVLAAAHALAVECCTLVQLDKAAKRGAFRDGDVALHVALQQLGLDCNVRRDVGGGLLWACCRLLSFTSHHTSGGFSLSW